MTPATPAPTHPNEELLQQFYEAFRRRDAKGMAECYAADVRFSDPVFPGLKGAQVGRMWRMLLSGGTDLELAFRDVKADDATGSAHVEARYTFTKTGRKVHNVLASRFWFRNGLIVEHRDSFGFWRWSRQALGATGALLGWTPLVRKAVRRQAAERLARFHDGKA
ncbi:MAG TPA: nuclear transport factor 2 family protein [Candidatus Thermoplasmatota archaeon]|nr:nuclear transport factor 2 family protein [Candidatus Thermoplasmatota archaeon]